MARDKQMAAIKASLEQVPRDAKKPLDVEDIPTLPIVEDEKVKKKEVEKSARDQLKEQEQTRLQAARITEENQRLGQEQSSKLVQQLQILGDQVQGLWKGTQVQLENIPTPGSLLFPFIVLMIFFFLLLPVNGHTRFVWLWLVLTGQAEISGGQEAPPSQVSGAEAPPVTTDTFVLPNLGTFGTFAQEVT